MSRFVMPPIWSARLPAKINFLVSRCARIRFKCSKPTAFTKFSDLSAARHPAMPKRYPSSWEYSNNPQTSTKWTSLTPIVSSAVAVETVSTVASLIRAANLTSDRMDCNIRSAGIATLKRIVLISRAVDTPTEALALLIANSASPPSFRPLRSSSSVGTAISSAVGHGAW
jgi:hypothetical protein